MPRSGVTRAASIVVIVSGVACSSSDSFEPCPEKAPKTGDECSVDPSVFCSRSPTNPCESWYGNCANHRWQIYGGCNPPFPPADAGETPDAGTRTCPDAPPKEGDACVVDPTVFCGPPCAAPSWGEGYWQMRCVDGRWKSAGTCNRPTPMDAAADASDTG